MSLVNMVLTTFSRKAVAQFKEEEEKAEPIIEDVHGNVTSELGINADTHAKVVLSKTTIEMLKALTGRDEWGRPIEESWDDIIVKLIKRVQKYKRPYDD